MPHEGRRDPRRPHPAGWVRRRDATADPRAGATSRSPPGAPDLRGTWRTVIGRVDERSPARSRSDVGPRRAHRAVRRPRVHHLVGDHPRHAGRRHGRARRERRRRRRRPRDLGGVHVRGRRAHAATGRDARRRGHPTPRRRAAGVDVRTVVHGPAGASAGDASRRDRERRRRLRRARPGPRAGRARPRPRRRRSRRRAGRRARARSAPRSRWSTACATSPKPESAERLVQAALDRFGRVDSATAFTGRIVVGRFLRSTVDDLRAATVGCIEAPYNFLRAVVPVMVEQGEGQVLVFTSAAGARPTPGAPLYSSARAGANMLVRNVAAEVAGKGVQVNAIGTNFMDFPEFLRANRVRGPRGPGPGRGDGADGPPGHARRAGRLLGAVRRRDEPLHHRPVRRLSPAAGRESGAPNEPDFGGHIGRTYRDSTPWWPDPPAGLGGPNVVLVVLDDTGFAHFGCYGSELATPTIDRLAANGLRYTELPHHRAVLAVARRAAHRPQPPRRRHARRVELEHRLPAHARRHQPAGRDGGRAAARPRLRHLRRRQVAPGADGGVLGGRARTTTGRCRRGSTASTASSRARPTSSTPELTSDNGHVDPPRRPEDGYHVSEDIVDEATGWISDLQSIRPDRPFFLYLAFGATHAPHQAPLDYRLRWRGRFDEGYDVGARAVVRAPARARRSCRRARRWRRRNPGVPAWDDLTDNQQRFAARLQEAFAAMLEHTDAQIGRLVDFLERRGLLDDTLLLVLSDNGASREGGPYGVMDEFSFFNAAWEDIDEHRRAPPRRHRRAALALELPVGLGAGRQLAAALVQAEHLRRRRARPARRALAERHRRPGRHPPPVLPRRRHHADDPRRHRRDRARAATTACRRSPCTARRSPPRSTTPTRPRPGRSSTSSRWATAACGPTAGRSRPTTSRASRSTTTSGACSTSTTTSPSATTSPPSTPRSCGS